VLLINAAEQRRRASRDNSASPPPTAVQTQQPQSAQQHVAAVNAEQAETVSSDAPLDSDAGMSVKYLLLLSVSQDSSSLELYVLMKCIAGLTSSCKPTFQITVIFD